MAADKGGTKVTLFIHTSGVRMIQKWKTKSPKVFATPISIKYTSAHEQRALLIGTPKELEKEGLRLHSKIQVPR